MGFFDFINPVMDILFGWTLNFSPFWAILIVSFIIALIMTFCYKWFTDQDLMKQLKDEMKAFQKQIKELKNHPEKAMEVQKQAMQTNMKYMTQSLKPTLVTFIPIILIFGWLQATFAFAPILPGEEFTTTMYFEKGVIDGEVRLHVPAGLEIIGDATQLIGANQASWTLKGESGEYFLEYTFNNRKFTNRVLVSAEDYIDPVSVQEDEQVKSIQVGQEKLVVMNLFGWKLGWLGTYIIFSIIFSMSLRKAMRLY